MNFCHKNCLDETDFLRLKVLLALWQTFQGGTSLQADLLLGDLKISEHLVGEEEGEWIYYAQLKRCHSYTCVQLIWHPSQLRESVEELKLLFFHLSLHVDLRKAKIILEEKQSSLLKDFLLYNSYKLLVKSVQLVFFSPQKLVRPQADWNFKIQFKEKIFTMYSYLEGRKKSKISTYVLDTYGLMRFDTLKEVSTKERKFILNYFLSNLREAGITVPLLYSHSLNASSFLTLEDYLSVGFQRVSETDIWIKTAGR